MPDRVSRRCGISSQLASSTVRAEVTGGAVTAATNKDAQQVFRNQRFVVRVQRSYRSYRFDGREIFASIPSEPADLRLMNDEIRLPAFRTQAKDYPTAACSKMIKGADVFRFHVTVHQEAIPSLATS